jgi:hypothetical protein
MGIMIDHVIPAPINRDSPYLLRAADLKLLATAFEKIGTVPVYWGVSF